MAGIAGLLVTNEENDSAHLLQKMKQEISHRRCEAYHTTNHGTAQCMIIGPRSFHGPDGELIIADRNSDLILSEDMEDVMSISGIFGMVLVIVRKDGISLLRTLDGTKSLYFGKFENSIAFASERKCLWTIGITSVQTLQPGQGATLTWNGNLTSQKFATLEKSEPTRAVREEIFDMLGKTLLSSFNRLQADITCAVLFSGGVDSSLAAILAARKCKNTKLVTARSEDSHDDTAAAEAAAQIGLPLYTVEMNSSNIWQHLPEVIYSAETSQQMDIEIALPFYLASKKAAEEGCTTVISGQGPDELFAGYSRHVKIFTEQGPEALGQQLWNEVSITHDSNIERDERAIAAHGTEGFFPYLDQDFVRVSLSIPAEWKVSPGGFPERKVILRELAQDMGLPAEIALKPKNATQYSSGSSRALLDSIILHVDGFSKLSKKQASRRVQDVLDEIAYQIGIPMLHHEGRTLRLDLEAVDRFKEKREKSSTSNPW